MASIAASAPTSVVRTADPSGLLHHSRRLTLLLAWDNAVDAHAPRVGLPLDHKAGLVLYKASFVLVGCCSQMNRVLLQPFT